MSSDSSTGAHKGRKLSSFRTESEVAKEQREEQEKKEKREGEEDLKERHERELYGRSKAWKIVHFRTEPEVKTE